MADENLAQSFFSTVIKASKATKKAGVVEASVTYTRDLVNKRITGSFILPLEETVNENTGEVSHKVVDSLQPVAPATTTSTTTTPTTTTA